MRPGAIGRSDLCVLAALAAALVLALFAPSAARAEACSEDGEICLETDLSSPLVPPTTLQFKIDSQYTAIRVILIGPPLETQLVEAGGFGGESVWSAKFPWIGPGEEAWVDGTYSLYVRAFRPPFPEAEHKAEATFGVPLLAPVVGEGATLRRRHNRFVARFSYTARRDLTAVEAFYVPGEPNSGIVRTKQVSTPAGNQSVSAKYPMRKLRRLQTCRDAWRAGNSCGIQAVGFATPDDVGNLTPAAVLSNARAFSRVLQVPKPGSRHR